MSDDPVLKLVEQIQAGVRVEESSEKLFKRFRQSVYSFFVRKGFSSEESRDLTQDVFLRVFRKIGTFRRESRFERWLWEIVVNIYNNEVRRLRAEKRDALVQSLDVEADIGDGTSRTKTDPQAMEPSPEEEVVDTEQSRLLRAALQELPDQMRRCCIFRYEKELKYQEIAFEMGISIETVKAHLHQARKRLIALLGDGPEKGKDP